jgi:YVTN family beta-propeller protein
MQAKQEVEKLDPYVGPRPFGRNLEDQERFFGRNQETEEIITLISSHQIMLIYAQSGAGKTSVLNAQVTPELEKNGFEVLPMARVGISPGVTKVNMSVESNILHVSNLYMFNAVCSLKPDTDPTLLTDRSLAAFLSDYFPVKLDADGNPSPQVIIFDQLEELFNLFPERWREDQETFFKQVTEALKKNSFLRVVFVIREDYLAQLDPFVRFLPDKLRFRYRLERLRKDAAILAIKGPLERTDYSFDIKEIEKLVTDLMKIRVETVVVKSIKTIEIPGEFVEPIQLQVVCQRWWRKILALGYAENTAADYGVDLANVDEALVDFYVYCVNEASKQTGIKQDIIRKWCERNLITSSGTKNFIHLDLEAGQTYGISNKAVEVLEERYLLRKEWRSGTLWYELTHDRLIGPIRDSNKEWKYENERKKKNFILKVTIPTLTVAIIVISVVLFLSLSTIYHIVPPPARSLPIIGDRPSGVSVNPATNIAYVANSGSSTVSVIDGKTNTVLSNITVGTTPNAISVNPATNIAYVSNYNDGTVSVIDGKTNKVITAISVGNGPNAISVNPATNIAYVSNYVDGTVSVIDDKTNTVLSNITVGTNPTAVSVNPATNIAYVVNYNDNTISILDGKTNSVVKTISVGTNPTAVSVNPATNIAYVANSGSSTVSVIDGKTNTVLSNITVGTNPTAVSVNPATNIAYVANKDDNTVSVIDGKTNKVITAIRGSKLPPNGIHMASGAAPEAVSVNPATNIAYVANYNDGTVSVIDGKTNTVLSNITVGNGPNAVSVNPATNIAYVGNYNDGTVSVIDGKTNKVITAISVGKNADAVSVNPATNIAYVGNYGNDSVSVIDGKTNTVLSNITVGKNADAVSVNPATNTAYVANYNDNTISILDGKTNSVVKTISVGTNPTAVSVNPATNTAYVANYNDNTISILDGKTNSVVKTISVGTNPTAVSVNPATNKAYVSNKGDGTVSVIDGKTNKVIAAISVGKSPNAISVNPATNTAYVANLGDDTVSVIDGKTNKVISNIIVGQGPFGISVNPTTNIAYVANRDDDTVSVIDGKTNTVISIK